MNLRRLAYRTYDITQQAITGICTAWAAHRRLLRSNRAYEAAMVSIAASVITQTRWDRFITTVISGLLDIYAAMRRASGRREDAEYYGWDMP